MSKTLNGYENTDRNIFSHARLNIRMYPFSHRTINEWNKLFANCVDASSVNMFRNIVNNEIIYKLETRLIMK